MLESAIAFAAVIVLVFIRIPIAFSMALVGATGFIMMRGLEPALFIIGEKARDGVNVTRC